MVEALYLLIKIRPKLIISTGAGIALPMLLIGKLLHINTIFIESFARIEKPSRTGKFAYKFVDVFVIQHQALLKHYPNAIYGGSIY